MTTQYNGRTVSMHWYNKFVLGRGLPPASNYIIETNIPIPDTKREVRGSKYPFAAMLVGQSFFVARQGMQNVDALCRSVSSSAYYFRLKNAVLGLNFTVRSDLNGVRVWRTK